MCPYCASAIPQPLSSSQLFHPAALPALGFPPCSGLELPIPGLASWAAAAQTLWGIFAAPSAASVPASVLQDGPIPLGLAPS